MPEESAEDQEAPPSTERVEEPMWSSKRLDIAYQEARAVLEAQRATASDIDQKTMRTVRLTAIIVGLALSVAQLGAVNFDPLTATIAVGVLIVSLIVGVLNYSASDPIAGPNPQYLSRLVANDFPETSWETHLLTEAGGWISDNEEEIARNGDVLLVQRALLVLGIQFIAVSLSPGLLATVVILVGPPVVILLLQLTIGIFGSGP
jgi:Flp pilus assembly protein TadB